MAIPHGEIFFLRNVPINASYEHTIDFKDKSEQFNYWLTYLKKSVTDYSYIRREREYIAVGFTMPELEDVNYIIFRSGEGERLYYAFVTDKTYATNGGTNIYYSIDVMQTYMFDYKWQASYIQQAHVDRWTPGHLPIYSKTDEGLAYGSEYVVESAYKISQSTLTRWLLVCLKDFSGLFDTGFKGTTAVQPVDSPFTFFLVPIFFNGLHECSVTNVGEGGTLIASYDDLTALMRNTAIGDYIISISLLSYNPFITAETKEGDLIKVTLGGGYFDTAVIESINSYHFLAISGVSNKLVGQNRTLAITDWDEGLKDSLPTEEEWASVKANPRTTPRDKRWESKLLCSPYRYNLLTDWRNAPIVIKNEYLPGEKIELQFSCAISAQAPFRYWVKDYKRDNLGRNTSFAQSISPDFPIISDAYYSYMLQNKNTIQTNVTNAVINAVANTGQGAISGAAIGGLWGAIGGAVTGAVTGGLNVAQVIRNENAKQADLQVLPSTVVNSNDSSFTIVDDIDELNFYRMRLCCENEAILSEVFNLTGYKVNRVGVPNTRSRVRFNYIQTGGANLIGSFNQNDLAKIKGVFDKGITIWHYSDKDFNFLNYDYENIEVNLI